MSEKSRAYNLYLASDHWQWLRNQKFMESGASCSNCWSVANPHVHHIDYKNLIDCTTDDLLVLCRDCHEDLHYWAKLSRINLIGVGERRISELISEFRNSPRWVKWRQKRAAKKPARPVKPATRKSCGQIFRKCLRRCRQQKYSVESIEGLIKEANAILWEKRG